MEKLSMQQWPRTFEYFGASDKIGFYNPGAFAKSWLLQMAMHKPYLFEEGFMQTFVADKYAVESYAKAKDMAVADAYKNYNALKADIDQHIKGKFFGQIESDLKVIKKDFKAKLRSAGLDQTEINAQWALEQRKLNKAKDLIARSFVYNISQQQEEELLFAAECRAKIIGSNSKGALRDRRCINALDEKLATLNPDHKPTICGYVLKGMINVAPKGAPPVYKYPHQIKEFAKDFHASGYQPNKQFLEHGFQTSMIFACSHLEHLPFLKVLAGVMSNDNLTVSATFDAVVPNVLGTLKNAGAIITGMMRGLKPGNASQLQGVHDLLVDQMCKMAHWLSGKHHQALGLIAVDQQSQQCVVDPDLTMMLEILNFHDGNTYELIKDALHLTTANQFKPAYSDASGSVNSLVPGQETRNNKLGFSLANFCNEYDRFPVLNPENPEQDELLQQFWSDYPQYRGYIPEGYLVWQAMQQMIESEKIDQQSAFIFVEFYKAFINGDAESIDLFMNNQIIQHAHRQRHSTREAANNIVKISDTLSAGFTQKKQADDMMRQISPPVETLIKLDNATRALSRPKLRDDMPDDLPKNIGGEGHCALIHYMNGKIEQVVTHYHSSMCATMNGHQGAAANGA